jgi:glutamate-1-semialdehyde 2,1-aminomutase
LILPLMLGPPGVLVLNSGEYQMAKASMTERKYRKKTPRSKEHIEWSKALMPGGVESNIRLFEPYPFVSRRGDGPFLYDIDGNKFADYTLGYRPLILGHRHPKVVKAVKEQVDRGSMFGSPTELPAKYVELVRKAMPSIEMFRFTNSGSEATMNSLRVVRAYTGKEKIAKAEGSYHGGYDYMMQSVDIPPDKLIKGAKCQPAVPWGKGLPKCVTDLAVVYPFNEWPETESIIRKNADDLAAVIIEPVHAGGGCVAPRDGYLKKLRKLTKELGILLVFDEVLTGFRVAQGGAQERYGVKPDITCIAKVAGGGYQLGGFGGKKEVMEEILPSDNGNVYHGGTYNAHAVSVAAGYATLKELSKAGTYSKLERKGSMLFDGLRDIARDRGVDVWVESIGSLGEVFFTDREIRTWRDEQEIDGAKWEKWYLHALSEGVFFGVPHPDGHAFLSLAHTDELIGESLEALDESFKAVSG